MGRNYSICVTVHRLIIIVCNMSEKENNQFWSGIRTALERYTRLSLQTLLNTEIKRVKWSIYFLPNLPQSTNSDVTLISMPTFQFKKN